MFTGIIEEIGKVLSIQKKGQFIQLSVENKKIRQDLSIGDSVAVNGVCLTASKIESTLFFCDVSPETIKKTTLAKLKTGDNVNLERAATLSSRLGGHLVSGHIDGVGKIIKREQKGDGITLKISADDAILKYLVQNGSVAVEGISLTVVTVLKDSFSLMIIPHTLQETTLLLKKEGESVNIETDLIGKYIERLLVFKKKETANPITEDMLMLNGFI